MKKLIIVTMLALASVSTYATEARLGENKDSSCETLDQSGRNIAADKSTDGQVVTPATPAETSEK